MKKFLKYFFLLIICLFLGVLLYVYSLSQGKPEPIKDENGNSISTSISTIEQLNIGGYDQYVTIRGYDSTKPVLLYLHGGPGSPETAILKDKELILEREFVVAYWDQRGSGKSGLENPSSENLNTNLLVEDAAEVSRYLIDRFDQDKIYVLGHSWGSFLGMKTIHRYPEYFKAYIGVGQIGNQYAGEKLCFDWVKFEAHQRGDGEGITELNALELPDSNAEAQEWIDYIFVERAYINKYGGGLLNQEVDGFTYFAKKIIFETPEYTIKEKLNYEKHNIASMKLLWGDIMTDDLNKTIDSIELPIYILQGLNDYQTPHEMAKAFFDNLKCEEKQFYTFEHSSHSPFLDEMEKFNSIIQEIILK